jgi:CDP-diacylglycerol--glycerol-3-phosphate 3-phosphatidyltransferase
MERPERVVMVVFGAVTGWIIPVLWIMLVLTYLTVLQRVYHVWRTLNRP